MSSVALLVAESSWFSPKKNKGQMSFVTYAESLSGLLRYGGENDDFDYYFANFYDKNSFEYAIKHLSSTDEERQVLYIGAHGDGRNVADASINSIAKLVAENGKKIKGVIISSCLAGKTDKPSMATGWSIDKNGNIVIGANWVVAYRCMVDWNASALIEFQILHAVLQSYLQNPTQMNSKSGILDVIASALSLFNKDAELGILGESIKDTLRLWTRPQGAESSSESTDELFLRLGW